jgi:hypothetical protein
MNRGTITDTKPALTLVIGPPPMKTLIGRTPANPDCTCQHFTDVFLTEATIGDQRQRSNCLQYAILAKTSHPTRAGACSGDECSFVK